MDKHEFITLLADALKGEVPADVIQENLDYYRTYLADEIAKGRDEQEVLNELGDPRLIAKTIIDACPESAENQGFESYTDGGYSGSSYSGNGYNGSTYSEGSSRGYSESTVNRGANQRPYETKTHFKYIDLSKWYWKVIIAVVVVALIWVVVTVVGGIAVMIFKFAWPLLLVWLIYRIIRDSGNR